MTETLDRVKEQYRLRTKLPVYKRRVAFSLSAIEEYLLRDTFYMSFSGGKDSLALLHLVSTIKAVPIVFIDSGAELDATHNCISEIEALGHKVLRYYPKLSIVEMCKQAAFWGAETDNEVTWKLSQWRETLLNEPARRALADTGVSAICLGLRKSENRGRLMMLNKYGIEFVRQDGMKIFSPIANWHGDDVIAYCLENDLPISSEYLSPADSMRDRESRRTGTMLGTSGTTHGRFQVFRREHPALWAKMLAEFPRLSRMT